MKLWTSVPLKKENSLHIFKIFSSKLLGVDVHLGKYLAGPNAGLSWHTDSAPDSEFLHGIFPGRPEGYTRIYRVNIILKHAKKGGKFIWRPKSKKIFLDWPRLKIFRADNLQHKVTRIEEGERLVLNIGFYRK